MCLAIWVDHDRLIGNGIDSHAKMWGMFNLFIQFEELIPFVLANGLQDKLFVARTT